MFISSVRANIGLALLCTSSVIALSSAAQAQTSNSETVVVTGSRVIADAANSPTPLTIVTSAQLQATTPSGDLTNALVKLPAFIGSNSHMTSQNATNNYAADALNLRNLGPERTLVLFDGKRAVSSTQDNTVNVSALPQMLVSRVDVVTGGASAVYGSDAVTGVVNFVLDKHFSGWKVQANAGISNYEDGASYDFGIAAGSDLFGGRGHIEGDIHATHQDPILVSARPNNANNILTGAGTKASPYVYSKNVLDTNDTYGGKITCTGCAANGMQFTGAGVIAPFNPGTSAGGGLGVGGDGGQHILSDLAPLAAAEESFGRFSYNINDDTTFYIQGAVNESYTKGVLLLNGIVAGSGTPNQYYANNPFLLAAAQAALANPAGTFGSNNLIINQGPWGAQDTMALVDTQSGTVGVDGVLGNNYNWSVFYTHGHSRVHEYNPHNANQQKVWAANDAVVGAGGNIQCYVSTTTYASLYPGCVPINPFGPNSLTSSQYNYIVQKTQFVQTDTLDDLGGSISGDVVDDWAGTIKGALSFEARWQGLDVISNATPGYVNCTGLRLCNTSTPLYGGGAIASTPDVSYNVWEFAGEVNVPLLKDAPLVQNLSLDLAGRYTDYSTSGSVQTWKIGLDYHVNDELRFRATNSVDIRAPSLYELYQTPVNTVTGVVDPHVGNVSAGTLNRQGGNPNLTPEIGRTYTAGVVYTPEFLPGLTASLDYYRINMTNVISAVAGSNPAILNLCEASGGTGSYCALIQRPLPFSNTTTFNTPALTIQEALNAAYQRTEGWDLELDYGFQLADVWAEAPGSVNLRMMANYSPVMESVPFPTSPLNFAAVAEVAQSSFTAAVSKGHVTSFLDYTIGSWSFDLLDRWIAGYPKPISYGIIYVNPHINSVNYQDLTIDKKFAIDGQTLDGYFSVQNIGNVAPPLADVQGTNRPGFFSGGITGYDRANYDEVGRYFTLGLRARF